MQFKFRNTLSNKFAKLCLLPAILILTACNEQVEQSRMPDGLLPDMAEVSIEARSVLLPYSFAASKVKNKLNQTSRGTSKKIDVEFVEKYTSSANSFNSAKKRILSKIGNECSNIARTFPGECIIDSIDAGSIGRKGAGYSGRLVVSVRYEVNQ